MRSYGGPNVDAGSSAVALHPCHGYVNRLQGQPEDLEARRQWPWWKAIKWALHITHRLFNRWACRSTCSCPGSCATRDTNTSRVAHLYADAWMHTCIPSHLLCPLHLRVMTCPRYGDPKKMDANSPDQAFATLFRDQCAVKFLEAHAALLGRYAEVHVLNGP